MLISEVIQRITRYCRGTARNGGPIDGATSRDQILWGSKSKECTGIVTTCYASPDVIREAIRQNANLIICHESLLWNHGDRTDWLSDNPVFQQKKALLDEAGITVWRFHDYIHSGIPAAHGEWADGIFLGLVHKLGWEGFRDPDEPFPSVFNIPEMNVEDLARQLTSKLKVNGARVVGLPDTPVSRIRFTGHALGSSRDHELISSNTRKRIDCELALEVVDYTLAEFIRDACLLGHRKALITLGHFDTEEPGMEYVADWLPSLLDGSTRVGYVQSGGFSRYLSR